MIGLPTETEKDIEAIPSLVKKVQHIGKRYHKFPNITVNISNFVPKPHTPFQWEEQISVKKMEEIHSKLKKMIRGPGIKLKFHNPKISFLEGIFSRGDRKLGEILLSAHKSGCRFDA